MGTKNEERVNNFRGGSKGLLYTFHCKTYSVDYKSVKFVDLLTPCKVIEIFS